MVFLSELALLLAESLTRQNGMAYDTPTYALKRSMAASDQVFVIDGSIDRSSDAPVNFTERVDALVSNIMQFDRNQDFRQSMARINETCIDEGNINLYYTAGDRGWEAIAQAGVVVSIMSQRTDICGYHAPKLISFLKRSIYYAMAEVERMLPVQDKTPDYDAARCFIQRFHKAIERLDDPADPLEVGFLTSDTCYHDTQRPPQPVIPRPVHPIGVAEGGKRHASGMVDVTYPPIEEYNISNFARRAWLLDGPTTASYASVWFILPGNHTNGIWDLFTVPGSFTLRLFLSNTEPNRGGLWLAGGCSDHSTSTVQITYAEEWNFVSVAVKGREATITFNDQSWKVLAPPTSYCRDQFPFLGPRLERPGVHIGRPQGVARFYDLKVSVETPASFEPLSVKKAQLDELGMAIPIICNTRDGFERLVGFTNCIPRPLFNTQFVYPKQDLNKADDNAPTAEVGRREYQEAADDTKFTAVNVAFAMCLLFLLFLSLMTLKNKFVKTNEQSKTEQSPFDSSLPIAVETCNSPLPSVAEELV